MPQPHQHYPQYQQYAEASPQFESFGQYYHDPQFDAERQPPLRELDRRVSVLERQFVQLDRRLSRVERRLQRVNQRLRAVEQRFNFPFTPFEGGY
ncbi:hypothetical protein CUU66_20955 [Peribacillus deserti]|uniref:Uncharacterized protein n=1 Tax=Peribacillus deserti TaxID=673318 RepID=A0A2N5M0W7_9BACI|nr:hypothetical protein CUU66_20955 [Peribacillus deserti]